MSNLNETPIWEDGIYQIELTDPVVGGADGLSNRQGKQLGNRTSYLKQLVEAILEAMDLKAPLANPTLTGTPKGPTAPVGTSTTQLATTAFVQAAVAALVNASPATLDTLAEIATALGNDPNFATTITTLLGQKAPLASPALTGTPTAPTAAAGTSTTQLATTAFVAAVQALLNTAIALKAPLASPTFTGTPQAPHAPAGSSTNQIATTYFVQSAVAALVNASPATLDTLAEIAAALGNDPNFATTITTLLGQKAPLASPALTGAPTAPTAAAGTSTTQLATTAFVQAAIAAFSGGQLLAENGYKTLSGGLVLQWMRVNESASSAAPRSWPVAFPNALFSAWGSNINYDADLTIVSVSTTGIVFRVGGSFGNSDNISYILALGY